MTNARRWAGLASFAALALLLAAGTAVPLAAPTAALGTPLGHAAPTIASLGRPSAPAASGAGTFFDTTSIPDPAVGTQACFSGACVNASENPSVNLTRTGVVGMAYTAYTNDSTCASVRNYAATEIGFVRSTDFGATWSSPKYLGNPVCTAPDLAEYPSAWEPSLASLGNGSFVLTYIEYNLSSFASPPPHVGFGPSSYTVPFDRLVVTRSFDGGVTWTTPLVLNSSANPGLNANAFAPQRPWVTATGATVYVAWMNLTSTLSPTSGAGSSAVHLVVSTNGGSSFGSPIDLPTVATGPVSVAMNPVVAVDPNGRLYYAYTTDLTFHSTLNCVSAGCVTSVYTADVLVATSTTNGSSFGSVTVASGVEVPYAHWGDFFDPSPALAISPTGTQVYVGYSEGNPQTNCYSYGYCYEALGAQVVVQNSSTHGASWSPAHPSLPDLGSGSHPYGADALYNPALAVDGAGTLHVEMTYVNYSVCQPGFYGGQFCGPQAQVYTNSTDQGATFTPLLYLSDNSTQLYINPTSPDGEYDTMIAAGGQLFVGWTSDTCPVWNGSGYYLNIGGCYWPSTAGFSAVQVSVLANASVTRYTLTFSETGLPAGTGWSVDVLGNLRVASAGTNLVLSGVPTGANLTYNLTVLAPYGERFVGTPSVASPFFMTAATTISTTFTEQVLLDISTVPALPAGNTFYPECFVGYPTPGWDNPYCSTVNWNVTPLPGQNWVSVGTVVDLNASPIGSPYCNAGTLCYGVNYLNLSFLSWKGSGAGSVNTTANYTRVTVNGPLNETASFRSDGWCSVNFFGIYSDYCIAPNVSMAFHENGLPAGTTWGVSVSAGGQLTDNQSSAAWLDVGGNITGLLMNYSVWTIPTTPSGDVYAATSTDPVSPVELPVDPFVTVNFTKVALSSLSLPAYVTAAGLPGGIGWSYSMNNVSYGSQNTTAPVLALSGGNNYLNLSPVTLANGTRYTPTQAVVHTLSEGASNVTLSKFPATFSVKGPTYVVVTYAVNYLVSVVASLGGSVSDPLAWVAPGSSVAETALPGAGFHFVAWSGSGAGAVASSSGTIHISPGGPVHELATFALNSPATYNVTVTEVGLAPGTPYSVQIGNRSFAGTSVTFVAGGIPAGTYGVALPYAYLNGSEGVRFTGTILSTSYGGTGASLVIGASGTLNLTYSAEYELTVSATGPGTIAGVPATPWVAAGSDVTLTATPEAGAAFVGWSGSGAGSENVSTPGVTLTLEGPVAEVAEFATVPVVVTSTYTLTISESGLPSGLAWSAIVGGVGYSSATAQVDVPGLNGSYTVHLPTLPDGSGVQYVPTTGNYSESVTAPASLSVTFTPVYLLTVEGASGGTVSPGSEWVAPGTTVSLTATATAGEVFVSWNGTGAGAQNVTTSTVAITVNGPVTESATFAAAPPAPTTPASTSPNLLLPVGLLIALLVAGLVVGYVAFRPRPPRAPPSESPPVAEETYPADATIPMEGGDEAPPSG